MPYPQTPAQQPLVEVQTIDLDKYRDGDATTRVAQCAKAAQSLHATGCLYVRDSRVAAADNERFLDLLERYFAASDGQRDARPELHYQVCGFYWISVVGPPLFAAGLPAFLPMLYHINQTDGTTSTPHRWASPPP